MKMLLAAFLLLLTAAEAAPPPVQYWGLPTGSHVAVIHFGNGTNPVPVIYLHGGPGADFVAAVCDHPDWWQRLGGRGADLYVYDQAGSGLSARLADPTAYTVRRHVDDLDAIRRRIGAAHMVLIGESWGAALAVNYMAVHPGVVVRAAFVSPGSLDNAGAIPVLGLPAEFLQFLRATRPAAMRHYEELDRLLAKDVKAAYRLAPDAEMDPLLDDFVNVAVRGKTVHERSAAGKWEMHGMGWWSFLMTNWDASSHPAMPHNKLAGDRTPVVIVRGESDYIDPAVADTYMRTFRQARLIRIAKAGHIIWLEQPKALTEALEGVIFGPEQKERRPL